jgi:formate hydrogenlyase transcriptional activator
MQRSALRIMSGNNQSAKKILPLRRVGEKICGATDAFQDVRLQFEQLLSDLSVKFINVNGQEVEREISAALDRVRDLFRFDRFGLLTFTDDKHELAITHSSYGKGISRVPGNVDVSSLYPWAKQHLLRGETIYFKSLDDLPEEAAVDRQTWQSRGVRANLTIPIHVACSVVYLIAASQVQPGKGINEDIIPRLRLLGEIFVNALVRCKSEEENSKAFDEIQKLKEKLLLEAECLKSEIVCCQRHEKIIGQSKALARSLVLVEQVAPTDSTVLICGETGTGKELIARAIHELSPRHNKPMLKVNCASLPAALVEGELFGREKGAYTGALTRQAGRFEVADGATIFLDEIAEMSVELQAKLLRVLQEGQFERLGSTKTIQVDVRVITATNRNLAEEVKKGKFREDLYYRLNVFQVVVPPLRDRIEDIPMLVWAFVNEFGEKMGKKINRVSKQDMIALQRYPWPGNVRELRNVIEYAVIVSSGDRLQVRLPETSGVETSGIVTLAEAEIRQIRQALQLTGWRIKGEGGAARLLGVNPSTLYSRMQKHGITNHHAKVEMSP